MFLHKQTHEKAEAANLCLSACRKSGVAPLFGGLHGSLAPTARPESRAKKPLPRKVCAGLPHRPPNPIEASGGRGPLPSIRGCAADLQEQLNCLFLRRGSHFPFFGKRKRKAMEKETVSGIRKPIGAARKTAHQGRFFVIDQGSGQKKKLYGLLSFRVQLAKWA